MSNAALQLKSQRQQTLALVAELKSDEQDFEWYPTTNEMLDAIRADMDSIHIDKYASMLDCGAGDGRTLRYLTKGGKYAIEKSKPLLQAIKHDVSIVGTNFHHQTLIDKRVDVIFCNPPYSEFDVWAEKIILEGSAEKAIYLVMPSRWERSKKISDALLKRNVNAEVIFKGDFLDAERQARAHVHIVRLDMDAKSRYHWRELRDMPESELPKKAHDAFELWFDSHFKINASKDELSDWARRESQRETIKNELGSSSEIIERQGLIEVLVQLYQRDLDKLMATYQSLSGLDGNLLKEMDVNLEGVKSAMRQRIAGLKDVYWRELFNRLESVTSRLTTNSRDAVLRSLFAQTNVDFSVDNAHALALWIVKNVNGYLDEQLIKTFERMVNAASVINYKSNDKTFDKENWWYTRHSDDFTHYKLDHRIVLSNIGGIDTDYFKDPSGLEKNAIEFLNDLLTVANNLGFCTERSVRADHKTWTSGAKHEFIFTDAETSKAVALFEAKAFKNGNIHLKLNQKFICALNCEFGRLKGWLKSRGEAEQELEISAEDAAKHFNSQLRLNHDVCNALLLGAPA